MLQEVNLSVQMFLLVVVVVVVVPVFLVLTNLLEARVAPKIN